MGEPLQPRRPRIYEYTPSPPRKLCVAVDRPAPCVNARERWRGGGAGRRRKIWGRMGQGVEWGRGQEGESYCGAAILRGE